MGRRCKPPQPRGVHQATLNFRGFGSCSLSLFPDLWLVAIQARSRSKNTEHWTLQPGAIHTRLDSKPFRCQNGPRKPWLVKDVERPYMQQLTLRVPNELKLRVSWCGSLRDGPLPKTFCPKPIITAVPIKLLDRNDSQQSGGVEGQKKRRMDGVHFRNFHPEMYTDQINSSHLWKWVQWKKNIMKVERKDEDKWLLSDDVTCDRGFSTHPQK